MPVAAFDLDGTVLRGQSGTTWAFHLAGRRLIPTRLALRVGYLLMRYRQSAVLDYDRLAEEMLGGFEGTPVAQFEVLLDRFVEDRLAPRIRNDARRIMLERRAEGCHVVLASAALEPIVARIARYLPVDGWIATRLAPHRSGCFSGRLDGPVRHGPAKVQAVADHAAMRFGDWRLSHAYTDHESDLALLEAAALPFAINASPGLRRIARARGWPLLTWR